MQIESETTSAKATRNSFDRRTVRAIAGALVGAIAGYALFHACVGQGYVILPLPGAAIGLGRDLATRHRSWAIGVFCLVLALAVQAILVHQKVMLGFAGMGPYLWTAYAAGGLFALWFGVGKRAGNPQ